jgi:hypothetical protein
VTCLLLDRAFRNRQGPGSLLTRYAAPHIGTRNVHITTPTCSDLQRKPHAQDRPLPLWKRRSLLARAVLTAMLSASTAATGQQGPALPDHANPHAQTRAGFAHSKKPEIAAPDRPSAAILGPKTGFAPAPPARGKPSPAASSLPSVKSSSNSSGGGSSRSSAPAGKASRTGEGTASKRTIDELPVCL